jgi:hypothetical protein
VRIESGPDITKVASAALQLVLEVRPKVPVYDPVEDTISASLAALEVLVSCCRIAKPLPTVNVPEWAVVGTPVPTKTNSFALVVVAVAPVLTLALVPCALAVRSSGLLALKPLYS